MVVFEKSRMDIGHIPAILPPINAAECRYALRNFIDAQNKLHAADQVYQQIAGNTGSILPPTTPAREDIGVTPGPFRCSSKPCVPIQGGRG